MKRKESSKMASLVAKAMYNDNYLIELSGKILQALKQGDEDLLQQTHEELEDINAFNCFLDSCKQISSQVSLITRDGAELEGKLIAIPLVFVKPENHDIPTLEAKNPDIIKFIKTLKTSGLYPEDSDITLYTYLYKPEELSNLGFTDVYKMLTAMTLQSMGKPSSLDDLHPIEPVPEDEEDHGRNVFCIRFLLGFTAVKANAVQLAYEDKLNALASINDNSQELLKNLIGMEDVSVSCIESFYDALEVAQDIYIKSTVEIMVQQELDSQDIHPRGAQVFLAFEDDGAQLELSSKLTNSLISSMEFDFNVTSPLNTVANIAESLEEIGFSREDIFAKYGDATVHIDDLLSQDEDELLSQDTDDDWGVPLPAQNKGKLLH